ncbi:MAG: DUF3352 domain-containing protein [Fimbriimonas sp.]|nr:DUF3352 domain-containing protein [Fimbriimonas sp.]
MIETTAQIHRRRRAVKIAALGVVVLATLGGAYAYKTLFARPGESALKYIPADAMLAVSIDLSPSPTQALVFKRIDDALGRNGLDRFAENSFLDMVDKNPLNAELAPLVRRGVAGCLDQKPGKTGSDVSGIIIVSLTDGTKAQEILSKHAQVNYYRGAKYYVTTGSHMGMMVVDDFLILAADPIELLKVKEIREGALPSITSVAEFNSARDQVASDANVLVFASPKLWANIGNNKIDTTPEWGALGIAIRDGGIGLSAAGKMDLSKHPEMRAYSDLPPIRTDLFDVMPAGSYGLFAVSDPASAFGIAEKSVFKDKDMHKGLQDAENSVEKSIGLSVKEDLLPGLQGDAAVGIYPSDTTQAAGLDVLAMIDDQNGGDPGAAVEKFQSFMNQQATKEGNAPNLFEKRAIEGGSEFRINDRAEADMRKGLGDGLDSNQFNKSALVGKKTVVFAVVGKTVIAATSQDLLDRAVTSYRSKTNGLAGDASFAPYQKSLLDGSQGMMVLSISRMAEGVKNTFHPKTADADGAKLFGSVMDALQSLKEPLTIKGKSTPDGISAGGVFIPMDFDKLIDIIGGQMKKK